MRSSQVLPFVGRRVKLVCLHWDGVVPKRYVGMLMGSCSLFSLLPLPEVPALREGWINGTETFMTPDEICSIGPIAVEAGGASAGPAEDAVPVEGFRSPGRIGGPALRYSSYP